MGKMIQSVKNSRIIISVAYRSGALETMNSYHKASVVKLGQEIERWESSGREREKKLC